MSCKGYYLCQKPAYVKYFNKRFSKELEVSPDDYIDIYQIKKFQNGHKKGLFVIIRVAFNIKLRVVFSQKLPIAHPLLAAMPLLQAAPLD